MTASEAPAAIAEPRARLDLGRVIGRTFGAIGANFVAFFTLAVLLAALPTFLIGLGVGYLAPIVYSGASTVTIGLLASSISFGATMLGMIPTYVLLGALTQGCIVYYNGSKASFGECLAIGFRFLLPLLGVGLLTLLGVFLSVLPIVVINIFLFALIGAGGIGVLLSTIAFVGAFVPAIVFLIRWSVAAPSLVVERTGVTGAFRRSRDLTSNNRWAIFFLGLIWVVITLGIQWTINLVRGPILFGIGGSPGVGLWLLFGFTILYSALNALILAAGQAALYYELRTSKEGATSEELAKIFE